MRARVRACLHPNNIFTKCVPVCLYPNKIFKKCVHSRVHHLHRKTSVSSLNSSNTIAII